MTAPGQTLCPQAVFNMDPETGMAFVEAQDGVEALWVYPDGTEAQSSGFGAYVDQ